jgi:hypothetical protein
VGGLEEPVSWFTVLTLDHPYTDIEVRTSAAGLEIRIPFGDERSALYAADEVKIKVVQENPVLAGSVIGDNDHDQDEDGRALPGSGTGPGGLRIGIERERG